IIVHLIVSHLIQRILQL
ncbi:hypothetical protein ABKN59_011962, partial [Abortiporus biennis]